MNKKFKLEEASLVIPDGPEYLALNVEESNAISLRRIADAMEKLTTLAAHTVPRSVFEEIFGKK